MESLRSRRTAATSRSFERRSAGVSSIHVLPLSADTTPAGPPVTITDAAMRSTVMGLAWTEGDSALVFSAATFLAPQSRLHRVPLTPDRLHAAGAPSALLFGDQALNLAVSREGRLVYSAYSRDSALWRLDLGRNGTGPLPPGIPGSTLDEHTPAFSRDGKRIAFASTRSGTEELWVANADGTALWTSDLYRRPSVFESAMVTERGTTSSSSTHAFTDRAISSCSIFPVGDPIASRPIPRMKSRRDGPVTARRSISDPTGRVGSTCGRCPRLVALLSE